MIAENNHVNRFKVPFNANVILHMRRLDVVFNRVGYWAPMHRSHDMAHAQWMQSHCQWYPMGDVRLKSGTDRRRIFKLGEGVDHVTHHV